MVKEFLIWFDRVIEKIPVAKTIYKTIKQLINSIADSNANAFQKVVYIEYPKDNIWTIAMVTGESVILIIMNTIIYFYQQLLIQHRVLC